MTTLKYIPQEEFDRIRSLDCSLEERTGLFATLCRINTLYMIMAAGSGHIGSSFSSLDIVSWLYLNELGQDDIYFSSKGHDAPGLYSVLCALNIIDFEKIHSLRRLGGLPGHPDVSIPGIVTNTGSLGMGVSKAKGIVRANRLSNKKGRVYVMTGDGELQEGQFWESLVSAVNEHFHEITVIVDHNKLQSDTLVSRTSDLGNLEKKFDSFGWHVQRINGHNFEELSKSLETAKYEVEKPSVIVADTIKGYGVSFMQYNVFSNDNQLYRYHSGAPSQNDYEAAYKELILHAEKINSSLGSTNITIKSREKQPQAPLPTPQRLVSAYSDELLEQGKINSKMIVLDADLKLDCGLIPFEKEFPDRFVECGIAEQDMVSQAGGLALSGYLPVVHSFACFLTPRANEQIYNNATEKTKIIYCGSLAGILPSGPGHSHQSVRDIDILASVPDLNQVQPCCEEEVKLIVDYCFNELDTSSYIRLTSIPVQIPFHLPEKYKVEIGKGCFLRSGNDALMIGYGPVMLSEACNCREILKEKYGFEISVVSLPWLNTVDDVWFGDLISRFKKIITLDDHYLKGGQGQMLGAKIAEQACRADFFSLGVKNIPECGTNEEVLKKHGLSASCLADFMITIL